MSLYAEHPLKVLVDNTVLDVAITHETRWITTNVQKIGDYVHHAGYQARVPVYSIKNKSERHRQASFLAGLIHLSKLKLIHFYTSAELSDERFRQPIGRFKGYGLFDRSLFGRANLPSIDGSVMPTLGSSWMKLPPAKEQQRDRIRTKADALFDALYQLLSNQLGQKCTQDCWHIRTAETHGCFAFLTTDKPLLKAWASLGHKEPIKSMKTKVLSPAQLAEHLGVSPVPALLLSYEEVRVPVRVDHTMPGEKRRPGSKYRPH
jgi:hypothetical protein